MNAMLKNSKSSSHKVGFRPYWTTGQYKPTQAEKEFRAFGKFDESFEGWAVAFFDGQSYYVAPMAFAREIDAQRAAESVNQFRTWGPTIEAVRNQILEVGPERFRRLLVENLAW